MQTKSAGAPLFLEIGLPFCKSSHRPPAVRAEDEVAEHWLRRDDPLRRLAQRDQHVLFVFVAAGWNYPRRAVIGELGTLQAAGFRAPRRRQQNEAQIGAERA